MAIKYHIDENAIYKFIVDTFNDNASKINTEATPIDFSIGYYFMDEGSPNGTFTRRFTQQNGRFDVKKTLDDETYLLDNTSFVPMNISSLNANYLAHNAIKEVTYEPQIEFLVYVEDIAVFTLIELVLKQIRARLIQFQTTLDVSYINIEDVNGARVGETLKVIVMSGELNYGSLVRVAGKTYLSMSMPLTIEVTNVGEYANQERIYLSVPSVNDGAYVEVTPIAWNYGVGIDTDGAQMLNDHTVLAGNYDKSKYVRSVVRTTAFTYGMGVQIDFNNPILYKIFKDSRKPTPETSTEVWKLKSEFSKFNPTTKEYEVDSELSIIDELCILEAKAPVSELSQGEKIIYSLAFVPLWARE
jgi:hypothetical protein